ncbi:MAG: RNA polymerase sigma factor [Verrucomicrobiae bacterium]|nr:RNA polymerase sigma factor [Verrucomicrobiae bacterium]
MFAKLNLVDLVFLQQTQSMATPDPADDLWFTENLLPHEPMLRGWLRTRFATETDVDDIVQEAFVRVLNARKTTEIASPKAFLFATARNLALGDLRKRITRGDQTLVDLAAIDILDENADVSQAVARSEELEFLTKAIQSLPTRCRQIITLRKIYGLSQKDIAKELGISVNTVETQGTIGMKKLGEFFERIERKRNFGF